MTPITVIPEPLAGSKIYRTASDEKNILYTHNVYRENHTIMMNEEKNFPTYTTIYILFLPTLPYSCRSRESNAQILLPEHLQQNPSSHHLSCLHFRQIHH